jgi:ABC-type transporter Mla subunit MlaD
LAPVTESTSKILVVTGVVALVASLLGGIIGLIVVSNLSTFIVESVAISQSVLGAVDETLSLIESVAVDVEEGIGSASSSIASASEAVGTAAVELEGLADFLDGELQASIEALLGTMPAAIQTAGVIDNTLSALSLIGVDYDPDQPFDESLRAVEDALSGIPAQLGEQAEAIRALVPVSQPFADDAAATAESFDSLQAQLESSQQLIDSYGRALDEAQAVVERTASSVGTTTWLLRLLVVFMTSTGAALGYGIFILGREGRSGEVVAAGFDDPALG